MQKHVSLYIIQLRKSYMQSVGRELKVLLLSTKYWVDLTRFWEHQHLQVLGKHYMYQMLD